MPAKAKPASSSFNLGDIVKLDPPIPSAFSQDYGRVVLHHGKHNPRKPRVRWSSGWGTTCLASHLAVLPAREKQEMVKLYPGDTLR